MIRFAIALGVLAGAAGAETLRVYTKPIEPFASRIDGKPDGFSLELWERIAKQAGLKYELTWVATMPELMDAVKSGRADVGVAAISITSDREKVIDFSQPYYESGLQILVEGGTGSARAAGIPTLCNCGFPRLRLVLA